MIARFSNDKELNKFKKIFISTGATYDDEIENTSKICKNSSTIFYIVSRFIRHFLKTLIWRESNTLKNFQVKLGILITLCLIINLKILHHWQPFILALNT